MARGLRGASPTAIAPAPYSAPVWKGATTVAIIMIAIIAVRLHEFIPYSHLLQPALLVTFGGLGIMWFRSPHAARITVLRHPLVRTVFAYWVLMIVTVPFALWPGLAFETVKYFLPAVALAAAILLCPPTRRTLSALQLGLVATVAAYAVYAKFMGRLGAQGRLSAGVGMYDANDMAAMLALTLPLAIGLARSVRGWQRWALVSASALIVAVVLASGSRGGLLGMSAGGIVLAFGMRGRTRIVSVALLVLTLGALWTFSNSFKGRLMTLTNLEADYNTFDEYGRKQVWQRGRQYIRDNPVIGVGAGNFPIAEGNYFGDAYSGLRGGKWSNAHNSYIQAYAELGLIGGTLLAAMLFMAVVQGFRLWRGVRVRNGPTIHRPELLASVCAFLVSGTFLSHAYYMPMVTILALTALADRYRRVQLNVARTRQAWSAAPAEPVQPSVVLARANAGFRFRGGLA